jgi:uncharacterized membrane protein YbhN (UPF0104 family)
VTIAVVFGLALLGAVLALGNPSAAWHLMVQVGWQTLLPILLLIPLYLAARAFVWRQMLAAGGVQLSWRPLLLAFASGEFAKNLPGGVYVEDYLLMRSGVSVSTSLAATTAVSGLEVLLAVPMVLAWGVPGWGWLFPTLSAMLLFYALALSLLWWLTNPTGRQARLPVPRPFLPVLGGLRGVLAAARPLLSLHAVRSALLPAAVSLGSAAVALVLLGRAVGVQGFNLQEAAVVYGFATLVLILVPIPTDLGVTEASGVAAMLAFGATRAQAVAALLLLRVVLTGGTMLVTGPLALVLWRQLRQQSAASHTSGNIQHLSEHVSQPRHRPVPREGSGPLTPLCCEVGAERLILRNTHEALDPGVHVVGMQPERRIARHLRK